MDTRQIAGLIAQQVKLGPSDSCEFRIYSPLLQREIPVYMFLDQPFSEGVSERQLRLVQQFLSLKDVLDDIKQVIFDHWKNGADYWEAELEFNNPDHAYTQCSLNGLFVMGSDHSWPLDASQLRFSVPWDTEHGVGVFIRQGQIAGFGDF